MTLFCCFVNVFFSSSDRGTRSSQQVFPRQNRKTFINLHQNKRAFLLFKAIKKVQIDQQIEGCLFEFSTTDEIFDCLIGLCLKIFLREIL